MLSRADLRPAQRRIITELKQSRGVQAVLGMGGGKTVSALTAMLDMRNEGEIRSAIVLAPKRVAQNTWPAELHQWAHLTGTDMVVLQGGPERRLRLLQEPHDVYVCGIDNVVWLVDALRKFPADDPRWDLLCIDELSRFKSPRGERAKKLRRFCERFGAIWGLTGTPRPNSWEDQWMPLQLVSGNTAWGAPGFDDWRRRRFMMMDPNGYSWRVQPFALRELRTVTEAWSFTIPPEEATDVPYNSGPEFDVVVPLTEEQRADLDSLLREHLVEVGREGTEIDEAWEDLLAENEIEAAGSTAVAAGKMAQILQGFLYRDGGVLQRYENAKLAALEDLLEANDGEPVLICYQYREDLEALRSRLGKDVPHLGHGVSQRRFEQLIQQWNAGELPVLLLHPASAGHGLNMQFGGRRMIWYAMTWSPELYAQTCKRIARPGQKLPVYVHRILYDHPLERKRVARVEAKMAEDAEFIAGLRRV